MRSYTTKRFRKAFEALPAHVQRRAREAYRQFQQNPNHPGIHFKQVHAVQSVYSVRIGLGYRALAVRDGENLIRFWIGTHEDYERLIRTI